METAGRRKSRHFDSLEQEAFLNLWRTYDRLRASEDALFTQFQLTPQQYNALRLLRGVHPETLATLELAGRLVSHAPDITRMLDRLEEKGWVYRERLPENRRIVRVGLSESGRDLLKTLDDLVRDCHHRQLGHLSESELRRLIELLDLARQPHEPADSSWRTERRDEDLDGATVS
ncbi:MAG: MarR family winged helix-turn-helix transcriptional regulator [Planctomycetia bacterium]